MLALCWHNVPAYYALNYAGIFDGGLITTETAKIPVSHPSTVPNSTSVSVRRNPSRNRKPPEKLTY